MSMAYIAIGANLGEPLAQAESAIRCLRQHGHIRVTAVSSWYRSTSLTPGQPDYLNGVCRVETTLQPLELLRAMQLIENEHGRTRQEHWGPRTLDLDLLLYDNLILDSDELSVPHPHLTARNFVVFPLLELAPALTLPDGRSLPAIADQLGMAGLARWQQNQ